MKSTFVASKREIVNLIRDGVFSFDPELITCLRPDYINAGMGWIFQQKICPCTVVTPICSKTGWQLVLAGGKFRKPAKTLYSPTEGEATACVEGLRETKYYTLGCSELYDATGHKPLVSILGNRALDTIDNAHLLWIKEKTFWWTFTMIHVPGLRQQAADALSRQQSTSMLYSLQINTDKDIIYVESDLASDMMARVQSITIAATSVTKDTLQVMTWSRLHKATQEDGEMMKLTEHIERGFPESQHNVPMEIKKYHRYRHSLHVVDRVVC